MNRNVESHFALSPQVQKPRSTFDMSKRVQTTFNVGELIPTNVIEVYPGDTFKCTTAKVVRLQTLLNPLFDTLYLDTYHFFCPDRIEYDHSEEMFGENKTSAWIPAVTYSTPQMKVNTTDKKFLQHSLADYFGLPINVDKLSVNAIPFRSYHDIWNTYFRDENLQDPLNIYKGNADKNLNAGSAADDYSEKYPWPRKAARYHDYFSSCLPAPQKGPDVGIPIQGVYPVGTSGDVHDLGQYYPMYGNIISVNPAAETQVFIESNGVPSGSSATGARFREGSTSDDPQFKYMGFYPNNLYAFADYGMTTATLNNLRQAFSIQRLYESDAIYGSRYYELLRGHFGIVSPDARLQRPEYLGGNRIALNVHQVVNSSESSSYDLGNLGAMSHTVDIHDDFVKSFVEHGFIISVCVVRYGNSYSQGIEPMWSRSDRFSYYWPAMAHLGNKAVLNKEIYATGTSSDEEVFGYQEAWAELRYSKDSCTGLMRPEASGSLAAWNLCDYYTQLPTLSADWIQVDKGIVDRTLAVTSAVSDQVLLNMNFDIKATRVLPMYSIPGLIDHF